MTDELFSDDEKRKNDIREGLSLLLSYLSERFSEKENGCGQAPASAETSDDPGFYGRHVPGALFSSGLPEDENDRLHDKGLFSPGKYGFGLSPEYGITGSRSSLSAFPEVFPHPSGPLPDSLLSASSLQTASSRSSFPASSATPENIPSSVLSSSSPLSSSSSPLSSASSSPSALSPESPLSFLSVKELSGFISVLTEIRQQTADPVLGFGDRIRYLLMSVRTLLSKQDADGSFENSLRETARAVSSLRKALSFSEKCGIGASFFVSAAQAAETGMNFLLENRNEWHNDIYDLVYILPAAAASGYFFPDECSRIIYGSAEKDPAAPGTTALMMNAVREQISPAKERETEPTKPGKMTEPMKPGEMTEPAGTAKTQEDGVFVMNSWMADADKFISENAERLMKNSINPAYPATACLILKSLRSCGFSGYVREYMKKTGFPDIRQQKDMKKNAFNTICLMIICLNFRSDLFRIFLSVFLNLFLFPDRFFPDFLSVFFLILTGFFRVLSFRFYFSGFCHSDIMPAFRSLTDHR